jgi:hypothetical protein
VPPAREEVGDPGGNHQRAGPHAGDRLAAPAVGVVQPIGDGVLVALEALLDERDRGQALHVLHPVPAGDHEPQRIPVLRRQRRAVHLPGEQAAAGVRERQRALVVLGDPALHAAV